MVSFSSLPGSAILQNMGNKCHDALLCSQLTMNAVSSNSILYGNPNQAKMALTLVMSHSIHHGLHLSQQFGWQCCKPSTAMLELAEY
jgi:hypothetical protein